MPKNGSRQGCDAFVREGRGKDPGTRRATSEFELMSGDHAEEEKAEAGTLKIRGCAVRPAGGLWRRISSRPLN